MKTKQNHQTSAAKKAKRHEADTHDNAGKSDKAAQPKTHEGTEIGNEVTAVAPKYAAAAALIAPDQPLPTGTDLEDAENSYKRMEPQALTLTQDQLTAFNVDVVAATSIILGVASRIVAYR